LSDKQVKTLLEKIDISQIEDRDSQEVVGYYNALDIITKSPKELRLTESTIKNLHNVLLKISVKDDWHRGGTAKLDCVTSNTENDLVEDKTSLFSVSQIGNRILIKTSSLPSRSTLTMYSVNGAIINEEYVFENESIFINKTMPSGIYFLALRTNKSLYSKKIFLSN
jgi:hypothetical protein